MLTMELFDSLMDELGEYLFLILFYNYGEPLLNRSLPKMIRRASGLDIETECHSNLSLPLSDAYVEEILTSGLTHLYGSIDGFTQPIYEIHRVGGNVDLVKQNLRKLAAARQKLGAGTVIHYNFLVFSFNEHEAPEAAKFSKDLGIEFHARDAFIHIPSWLPSYRRNERPFIVAEEIAPPPEFSYRQDGQILSWSPLPEIDESKAASRCGWHYGYSVVQPRGELAPCCAVAKEKHDFGTVVPGRRSFAEVWNNDLYRSARAQFAGTPSRGPDKETICTRCPLPKFIQHLFSARDAGIVETFYNFIGEADPELKHAFDLMVRTRWELPQDKLSGTVPFSGLGNEKNSAEFVRYVEETLLSATSVAQ
jgi:MoaA/NifB/PqqE/SkfB family radical SAM enzyme